jgi:hypothetical protein
MTFQPIAGTIVNISTDALQVLTRAAAKRKATPHPRRSALTDKCFREQVRRQLLAGTSPHHFSPDLVEQLEQADPAVHEAVGAWYAARVAP